MKTGTVRLQTDFFNHTDFKLFFYFYLFLTTKNSIASVFSLKTEKNMVDQILSVLTYKLALAYAFSLEEHGYSEKYNHSFWIIQNFFQVITGKL